MKWLVCCVLTAFACTCWNANNASADLITNGSFSANATNYATWPGYSGSGGNPSNPTGWNTVSGQGNSGVNGPTTSSLVFAPESYAGYSSWAFLQYETNTDTHATMYQEIHANVGQTYKVSFDAASRNNGVILSGLSVKVMSQDMNTTYTTFSTDNTLSKSAFHNYSYNFTAEASDLTLAFEHTLTAAGDATALFTNVSVNAVPEPSSIATTIIGLISLMAYGWRRRK